MIYKNQEQIDEYISEHGWNDNHCKHCGAEIPAGLEVCPVTEEEYKEAGR